MLFLNMCSCQWFFRKKRNLFLRVYERRDKCRYLIKKGVHGKNKVISGLSSCVMQKFSGFEIMKNDLQYKEKKHFEPTDIVYDQ